MVSNPIQIQNKNKNIIFTEKKKSLISRPVQSTPGPDPPTIVNRTRPATYLTDFSDSQRWIASSRT